MTLGGSNFSKFDKRHSMAMFIHLKSVREEQPGNKWKDIFDKRWPHYKNWYLKEGYSGRPGYLTCYQQLKQHMPEIVPVYDQLVNLAGGGDLEARYLSQYNPPPFMSGCSQVAWTKDSFGLIRNYDYSPFLFDGILLYSKWIKPVIAITDSAWGVLDGINGDGVALSLTFGGRKVMGDGFGIPLILRYTLEVASNTHEAIELLTSIPSHMSYNITVMDASGFYATVYLSPDKSPVVTQNPIGTNHQVGIDWEDYARMTATIERQQFIEFCLRDYHMTKEGLIKKFLQPPLYSTKFEKSFGTLYTSSYDPLNKTVDLFWPNKRRRYSFDQFEENQTVVNVHQHVNTFLIS